MDIEALFSKAEKQLLAQLPFVIYKKPGQRSVQAFFQKNNSLHTISRFNVSGFVFSPFDYEKSSILFPINDSELCIADVKENVNIDADTNHNAFENYEDPKEKPRHIDLVRLAIDKITKYNLQKVVVSRKEKIPIMDQNPIGLFKHMINTYQNAFNYLWYHPEVGIWIGATPETLLAIKDRTLYTMALAGTQPYLGSKNVRWGRKEVEEQQLVTAFILQGLKEKVTAISKSDTYTHKAGGLLHLRTDIKAQVEPVNTDWTAIIRALHPTPAVCGLPRDTAQSFIRDHEGYDRAYYTGFLGELNMGLRDLDTLQLYVNLRCMQLEQNLASIYVGGGITKDSDPEKEWEETVRKTETMKGILL